MTAPQQPAPQQQPNTGQPQQGQQPPAGDQGQGQQQPTGLLLPAGVAPPAPPPAPNPWAGLLDLSGQGQQGQGQQAPPQYNQPPAPPAIDPGQLADLIGREVDRRVNARLNPQYQQAHGQQGQQQQPPPTQQGQQQQYAPPPAPPGPSDADRREGRMAVREYLNDRIQLGSEAERALAADLATSLIDTQLQRGLWPDQAGREVAGIIAERITQLRRTYETQLVTALRSRGLLVESPQGQLPATGAGPQQQLPAPVMPALPMGVPVGGTPAGSAGVARTNAKATQMAQWAQQENAAKGWNANAAPAAT